jgi:hypothetical protein
VRVLYSCAFIIVVRIIIAAQELLLGMLITEHVILHRVSLPWAFLMNQYRFHFKVGINGIQCGSYSAEEQ